MQTLIDTITELYTQWAGKPPARVDVLPQAGSERRYFRLTAEDDRSVIGTWGANVRENETFAYFAEHFHDRGIAVPALLHMSADKTTYLQQDFGDRSLLQVLEEEGYSDAVYSLFRESLRQLARLQVRGDEGLDYSRCLTNREFGKQAIMADLLYFKYYFLDALRQPYDKQQLIDDFEALANYLTHTEYRFFLYRDFQSRNILVREDGGVGFIDFQGGMKGAPQYDVASLLWQAKAALPADWKDRLLEDYLDAFGALLPTEPDRAMFRSQYNGYVLIRLLQVLGAYGFRGLFERKAHFLTSIPLALQNLRDFLSDSSPGIVLPELRRVLDLCVADSVLAQFTPLRATDETPLVVSVCSFSYKKGYPADNSGNGGGYVFDCRGILNPGRFDEYKEIHGRDKPVMEFLEQRTKMPEFLNSVFDIVDISVEDYIKRGFAHLSVSFGCTGGQHRSVYAADALARHLRNKYNVKVELCHTVQEAKNWINKKEL
ncbi:RapZ C-terminal domain-containing protein [Flaviaesturariibacter terrae]